MAIRRATPQDAEGILELWRRCDATVTPTDDPLSIRFVAEHPWAVFLVAVTQDEIVGSLLGTFDGWRGNIYRLAVRPEVRREGIARGLVRAVEEALEAWGVKRIRSISCTRLDGPLRGCSCARPSWIGGCENPTSVMTP